METNEDENIYQESLSQFTPIPINAGPANIEIYNVEETAKAIPLVPCFQENLNGSFLDLL